MPGSTRPRSVGGGGSPRRRADGWSAIASRMVGGRRAFEIGTTAAGTAPGLPGGPVALPGRRCSSPASAAWSERRTSPASIRYAWPIPHGIGHLRAQVEETGQPRGRPNAGDQAPGAPSAQSGIGA